MYFRLTNQQHLIQDYLQIRASYPKPYEFTSGVSVRRPYTTEWEGIGRLSRPWVDQPYCLDCLQTRRIPVVILLDVLEREVGDTCCELHSLNFFNRDVRSGKEDEEKTLVDYR